MLFTLVLGQGYGQGKTIRHKHKNNQKMYLAINSEKVKDTLQMKCVNVVEVPYKLLSF